jgi:hypothetical protein
LQSAGSTNLFSGWPWIGVLFVLILIAAAWRFRSGLIGVLENVVVMGRSGADLETELLHHEPAPEEPEADPPVEPEAPAPDPDAPA